jgi:hypothetical protein
MRVPRAPTAVQVGGVRSRWREAVLQMVVEIEAVAAWT